MYHSVAPYDHDPYLITVSPPRFEEQMRWLWRQGKRGVAMRELLERDRDNDAADLVGLTFDDGYADFADNVLPVLDWYGFTATVFVVAGRMGKANDWDADGPRKPLLTAAQIQDLVTAGVEVASHSSQHTRLPAANDRALRNEVVDSREIIEDVTGRAVTGFCYPYGELDDRTIEAVRDAGYDYACAVSHTRFNGAHAIPRTYVGDRDNGLRLTAKRIRHRLRARRNPLQPTTSG
jgi:peptidoglycan/xylan/chitin deacetylase (PgdA/CDA1 family)